MSKRSHSPHHRFPFKEPRLDCYKGLKADKDHVDRRQDHTHLDFLRENPYSEGRRRSPVFSDDHRPFRHYNHSSHEEFHYRPPPPRYSFGYGDRQALSPPHHREEDRHGHREGSKGPNSWVRTSKSPLRIQREELSSTPRFHSDHQQREARMGKRREEQGGGWEKFRELSAGAGAGTGPHAHNWESGWERGRRNTPSSDRERQREDPHQERGPPFRRQRRKLEDVHDQNGYRDKELEEQHHAPRQTFGRGAEGRSGPLIIEHDHGFRSPSRGRFDGHRDRTSAAGPTRSFHPAERYRMSEDGPDVREDASGRRDDGRTSSYPEARRSPVQQGRRSSLTQSKQKGKSSFHARAEGGGAAPPWSHALEPAHGSSDRPQQEQRSKGRPFLEENYKSASSTTAVRQEEAVSGPWTERRARSLDGPPPDIDLDPKMPRQRMAEWSRPKPKNVTMIAEETLTIKVDMNQAGNTNSVLCYSSDRQLSLDLVNVGRQRLDFLPMLEHSGTYRESPAHTGTFAQEIITLVHHVKERYFGGRGLTLNERFSKARFSEDEEAEKPTLNQRFSSNQGLDVKVKSVLEEEEPVFSSLLQPVRGPGDLRHDLERRRQERTEGVKVTITGGRAPQRPLGPASGTNAEFRDEEDETEPEGFSHLPAQHRRREFHLGSRRGGPHRPFKAFQRINCGVGNQFRLIRRQKNHSFHAGPSS